MSRVIGATIKLDGEAKFKSAVTDVNRELNLLKSESKLVKTEFAGQENSIEALSKKQEILARSYDLQKQKTEAVRSGLDNAKRNYESVGKSLDEYRQKLETARASLQTMKDSGTASDEELKAQKSTVDSLSETVSKGEKTYAQAGTRITDWGKKLNYAKTEEINTGNAIKENNQYMYEAITSTDKCATSIDKFGKQTKSASTEIQGFGESANKYFSADIISQYADKASAAMSSFAKATYAATKEVDEGYDTLIQKTGASGNQLASLKSTTDNIFSSMPVEMEDVSSAVGDVNKRFDETGKQLEGTTKTFLEFSKVNGSDVSTSIESTEKILKQFNVDTSQASNFLGMLTKKQQETGISADTMMSSLEANSSTLKIMGLDLTSSTDLLAQFEKNGVDVDQAMQGLKKSVAAYTDQGMSANDGLKATIDSIKNAKTETEAYKIAMEVFGKKGFQPMAVAIREGKINLDSLSDSLENYSSVVDDTYQATIDPWDDWTTATNSLKEAGSELAGTVLEDLRPAIKTVTEAIKDATSWYSNLDDRTKKVISVTATLVTGLGIAAPQILKIGASIRAFQAANKILAPSVETVTSATEATATAAKGAAGATDGLVSSVGILTAAAPIAAVAIGAFAAVGITALVDSTKPADRALQELNADIDKTSSNYAASKADIDNATSSYTNQTEQADSLARTIETLNGKESLNTTEKRNLAIAVQQLNDLMPDLNLTIDSNTGKLSGNTKEILTNIEAKKRQYEQTLKEEKEKTLTKEISELEIQQKEAEDELAQAKSAKVSAMNESVLAGIDEQKALNNSQKTYDDVTNSLDDLKQQYAELTGDTDVLKNSTDGSAASFNLTTDSIRNFAGVTSDAAAASASMTDAENAHQEASQYSISIAGQELDAFNSLSAGEQQMAVDVTNAVASMQQSVEGAIQSQCDWFGKLDDSGKTSAQSIIDSMQSQVNSVHNWEENLTTLSTYTDSAGQHIDSGLLQSLADLGPQGAAYVQALVDDGGASLSQLNDTWSQKVDMTNMTDKWGQDLEAGVGNIAAGGEGAFDQLGADLNLKTNESGQYVVQGLVDGMAAAKDSLATSGEDTANSLLNSLNSNLGVASPSTKTYESGTYVVQGLVNGMTGDEGEVVSAAQALGQMVIDAINNNLGGEDSSSLTNQAGIGLGRGLAEGLDSQSGTVISSASVLGQAAIQALMSTLGTSGGTSMMTLPLGSGLDEGLVSGISGSEGVVMAAATSTSLSTISAFSSALGTSGGTSMVTLPIGSGLDAGLTAGIKGSEGVVMGAASSVGNSAVSSMENGADSSSMYGVGLNLSEGLASGIWAGYASVAAAASAVAAAAEVAARAKLEVNSPSKVFKRIGGSVIEGFVDGVNDGKGLINKTINSAVSWNGSSAMDLGLPSRTSYSSSSAAIKSGDIYNLNINGAKINDGTAINNKVKELILEIAREGHMYNG